MYVKVENMSVKVEEGQGRRLAVSSGAQAPLASCTILQLVTHGNTESGGTSSETDEHCDL